MNLLSRARLALRAATDSLSGSGNSTTNITAWDAARAGSRLAKWTPPSTDFVSVLSPTLLRARARDAVRNISWARRAVGLLADYTVGTGIKPQVGISDAALRQRVHAAWTRWTDSSDWTGRYDFYGQQHLVLKTAATDGEVLLVVRPGDPLKIQLLPCEYLDSSRDNARDIIGGIEFDAAGQRTGYYLFSKNPAEAVRPVSHRVDAAQVVHLFSPQQPGYERGVSWLAPALLPIYELRSYSESALVRARTSSLFCGFIRSADGTDFLASKEASAPSFEPGSLARLRPGDELQFTAPPDPSNSFDPFIRTQLRSIAAALGVPYELLSGDFSQVTFASGRGALLAFKRGIEVIQHGVMAYQLCRPIWSWWVRTEVALGRLPATVLEAPVRWIAPALEMLDSRMEIESTVRRIRAGLLSRSEAVSNVGLDPEALHTEIAADNARADRLQLVFDSDPRRVSQQGQQQVDPAGGGNASSGNGN